MSATLLSLCTCPHSGNRHKTKSKVRSPSGEKTSKRKTPLKKKKAKRQGGGCGCSAEVPEGYKQIETGPELNDDKDQW